MLKVIIFLIFCSLFISAIILNAKEIFKFFLTHKKIISTILFSLVVGLSIISIF